MPLRVMNSDCAYSYKIPLEPQMVSDRNYPGRKFVAVMLALVLIVPRCLESNHDNSSKNLVVLKSVIMDVLLIILPTRLNPLSD